MRRFESPKILKDDEKDLIVIDTAPVFWWFFLKLPKLFFTFILFLAIIFTIYNFQLKPFILFIITFVVCAIFLKKKLNKFSPFVKISKNEQIIEIFDWSGVHEIINFSRIEYLIIQKNEFVVQPDGFAEVGATISVKYYHKKENSPGWRKVILLTEYDIIEKIAEKICGIMNKDYHIQEKKFVLYDA